MESKETKILEIFFEEPTKEWHFEEILKTAKIGRSKATIWLKKFIKQKIIKRIKEKGKMPYYTSDYTSSDYQNKKKIFALNQLYESGFLNHLNSLKKAKSIIIFGSITRSDWYKKSDIDLFIYGNSDELKITEYETKLRRDIQVFECKNANELEKYGEALIKNIIKGNIIKGDLEFIKLKVNA